MFDCINGCNGFNFDIPALIEELEMADYPLYCMSVEHMCVLIPCMYACVCFRCVCGSMCMNVYSACLYMWMYMGVHACMLKHVHACVVHVRACLCAFMWVTPFFQSSLVVYYFLPNYGPHCIYLCFNFFSTFFSRSQPSSFFIITS
jgi:hypothetical protein